MKTFARFTGWILIVFGILIIVVALAFGFIGGLRDLLRVAGTFPAGRGIGPTGLLSLILLLGYGLLVSGVGQGLHLLAGIASRPQLAQ